MNVCITKAFTFDAAHNLVNYNGKCEALHGHTYRLEVTVCGSQLENGLLMDFGDLKQLVDDEILSKLDHTYLNDRFQQPSTELIAIWIFQTLQPLIKQRGLQLKSVKLFETATSWVEVSADA
jgi:6-pyruvoyltetrahydropterin/6-carboxytetrahydropterin synthase